jgi:hypothetical protein
MEPNELAERIESLIISSSEAYEKAIKRVQNQLYNRLVLRLKDLELQDGYIKQNAANRLILREAQAEFDFIISNSEYQSSLEKHLKSIPKINELNTLYFQTIESAFTPNKNFIKSLQSQTIKNVNALILQDGIRSQIKIPLNQILEQNVSTGGTFTGMLKQVSDFVKGNEDVEGRLLRYTKTYLNDILFQYARSFQQSVTADLKLEWYLYAGGLIRDSREFCQERTGKFFNQKEIESWAKLSWKGKDPLTTESSIFIVCGGFNCRHELIPVSIAIVPKEDLDRI